MPRLDVNPSSTGRLALYRFRKKLCTHAQVNSLLQTNKQKTKEQHTKLLRKEYHYYIYYGLHTQHKSLSTEDT